MPPSYRAPEFLFFEFFGSPSLTACPVSDRHSIFLDFSLGYDEASHSRWIDAYEGLGFMRALSSHSASSDGHIEASTTEGEEGGEETRCELEATRKREEAAASGGWQKHARGDRHRFHASLRAGDQWALYIA